MGYTVVVHVAVLTISEQRAVEGTNEFCVATITLVSGQISIFSEYLVFGILGFRNIDMAPSHMHTHSFPSISFSTNQQA